MILPKAAPSGADVAHHYDELDPFYRGLWGEHVHHGLWLSGDETVELAVRQMIDLVAAEADVQPGAAVCDVGAGYGGTARHLVHSYGARVTALTISPAQHRYATSRPGAGGNPHFVLQDWLENDLPSASFDVVTAIECAAHMSDKPRFLAEAFRVLRPGGRFVFCAWLADEHPTPWQVRLLLEPICREGRLAGLPTASEYLAWTEAAGLALQTFEDLSARVAPTWSVVLRRVGWKLATDPRYLRYLLDPDRRHRTFALTLVRLWLGFRTGAFRYGLFCARRPRR